MQEPTIYRAPIHYSQPENDNLALPNEYDTVKSTANISDVHVAHEDLTSDKDYHHFVIPEDRKLGVWSTAFLIINRVVGTGIYSTPSTIIKGTNNVGTTLLFWFLGGIMTFAGLFVYLEFGTTIPRSGGEKVYLERVYRRPRYLATCIFAVQFILFAVSTGNSISFSTYILRAATGDGQSGSWLNRGIAVAAITVVCLIHAFTPKLGIMLSNALGTFKLVLLLLVVCAGFATLAGSTVGGRSDTFTSFAGPGDAVLSSSSSSSSSATSTTAGYALALLQVLYSYSGWENANYVLGEVQKPQGRTLKRAAPLAVAVITILYILANVAYFAAMSKHEIANSQVVVAATFFEKVWGPGVFVTRVLPVFIALSAIGNVFAQSFAMPRVKQEFAKEGILPFSRFWSSDWPKNAPSAAIMLHWLFTVALILGSKTSDTYTFVTNIFIYSGNWVKLFLGAGLLYLTFNSAEGWRAQQQEQGNKFKNWPPLTIFWMVTLLFSVSAPFIPNTQLASIPFWVVPTLGTSMLFIGTLYWLIWAKLLPLCGFHVATEVQTLADGSERVRYIHVHSRMKRRY